jgi:hypothetical protein
MTIWVGGTTTQASAGSFVYGPQGVPHTILVTSPVARYLLIMDPAGFEKYVRGVSTAADRMISSARRQLADTGSRLRGR